MHIQRNRRHKSAFSIKTVLKSCLFSLLISAAAGLFFAVISAWLLLKTKDPARLALPIGIALSYLVALFCGFLSTRFSARRAPLLHGAILGALLLLISLAAAPFNSEAAPTGVVNVLLHALLFLVACGGAWLGAKHPSSNRKRRYRT